MSVRKKIVISLISILVVAGLVVAGLFLFKSKNQEYNLNGGVKFAVEGGVTANIQGNITGEAKDKKLNSLVYSVISKPNESALNSWENIKLNFEDKSQPIKITIIVNNTDTEDLLFVELVGSTGESDNIKKVVKLNGEGYQNNQIIELASYGNQENSRAIFNIELSVIDIEQEVKDVDFTYQINLYKEYVETQKLIYIFNDENQTASVKMQSTEATTGKVIIPETVIAPNGLPYTVTSIEPSGFSGCLELTSITLPDTLITVGDKAFENCVNLAYTIKENGRYLGNANNPYMFLSGPEDSNITTFNVNSSCKILGYRAFLNISTLETINLPDGLISMGDGAFNLCSNLQSISMPDSITHIGVALFQSCSNLKTVKLSKNISEITSWMFNKCYLLETINLENVKAIGYTAFYYCEKLNNLTLSKSLTRIEAWAFDGCKSLESINLENVKEIGKYAFQNCYSLETINLNNVSKIGEAAFQYCSILSEVVLSDSIEIIEPYTFNQCRKLKIQLPDSIKQVRNTAFQGCSSLTDLTLPSQLEFIGDFAFNHCSNAINTSTFTLPASIKQIGGKSYDANNPSTSIIGAHVFYDFATSKIKAFEISENNPYYMTIDGVLYRKANGKPTVLVAYPAAKTDTVFDMPDTVVDAYELSFSKPYNLREIKLSDAFVIEQCNAPNAFNKSWGNNLVCALYVYNSVTKITCNETNPNYISINGQVYSKDGTKLYYASSYSDLLYGDETEAILKFSEGLTTITYGAIGGSAGDSNGGKDQNRFKLFDKIIIPASVTSIDNSVITEINEDHRSWIIEVEEGNVYYEVVNNKLVAKV